jgi:hypothetical protein
LVPRFLGSESNRCTKEIRKREHCTSPELNRFIDKDYSDKLAEILMRLHMKQASTDLNVDEKECKFLFLSG